MGRRFAPLSFLVPCQRCVMKDMWIDFGKPTPIELYKLAVRDAFLVSMLLSTFIAIIVGLFVGNVLGVPKMVLAIVTGVVWFAAVVAAGFRRCAVIALERGDHVPAELFSEMRRCKAAGVYWLPPDQR